MCGIAGYFGFVENTPKDNVINECLHNMDRRGPDNKGICKYSFNDKTVILLHSRLSIIDPLPEGNQPFIGEVVDISFNGEIYNYLEIKSHLKKKGVQFSTKTDTEVLVKLFEEGGVGEFDKIEGMWAFAAFNKKEKNLTLCRDSFGEKPLYYYTDGMNNVYFASNINYILTMIGGRFKVDFEKIKNYLHLGFQGMYKDESTFFTDIKTLLPNQNIKIDKNLIQIKSITIPLNDKVDENLSYKKSVSMVRSACLKSFKDTYKADVPVASLISGGIDSTVIGVSAKKIFNQDVSFFSIKAKPGWYDESSQIDSTVDKYCLSHEYVDADVKSSLNMLKNLVLDFSSPIPSGTSLIYAIICKHISSLGYKVLLTGNGGDEMFAGYYVHHLDYLVDSYGEDHFEDSYNNWKKYIFPILRNNSLKDFKKHLELSKNNEKWYDNADDEKYYKELFKISKDGKNKKFNSFAHLKKTLLLDLFEKMVPQQMVASDSISMYFSMENRAPFLSMSLLNTILSIPSRHFIKNGYSKALLRDAFKDIIPYNILNEREKVGFNMDINDILDINSAEIRTLIEGCDFLNSNLDMQKILKDIKKPMTNSFSKFMFRLINISLFLKEYDIKNS
jgi:asparagine synthase (glutamine-hydrolysing)